ncbi:hypothetical protein BS329_39860 [Amycolatopsis coloradensis]|uniref:DUF2269 domain-containing protein n=1 Tax=Amycolatopsis coloradensis TaxID=76021 RepID=A0A1R0KE12_9PSEU|nr:hypothetical protein [Amycolatopsis coloradensis]OLZ43248.1 hypothetical protein BS329_39860 [Amycolatopsis coloradensis]
MSTSTVRRSPKTLPPRWRKLALVVHVVSSLGWLGITMVNAVLTFTSVFTDDPRRQQAAILMMDQVGGYLLLPISLTALVSGIVLSTGTKWGLVRYRWVAIKLVLTLIAAGLTLFSLLPGIGELAAAAESTMDDAFVERGRRVDGFYPIIVSTMMYMTMTVLSVYKPGGKTPYGRRVTAIRVRESQPA